MRTRSIYILAAAALAALALADAPPGSPYPFPKRGDVPVLNQKGLAKLIATHGTRLLVVNVWATWCAPCVEELPYFQDVQNEFAKNGVQVVALSMDMAAYDEQWPEYTHATVRDLNLDLPVFQLDIDTTRTVPWMSEKWSGALPATFFYDEKGNKIGEALTEMNREQLYAEIGRHLAKTAPPRSPAAPSHP